MLRNMHAVAFSNYIKIARFDHWIKQLFIIPGIIFAIALIKDVSFPNVTIKLLLGFFSTCFIASANYVINEWLDAEFDKFHPTKKNRPVVANKLSKWLILLEYSIFAILGLLLAYLITWPVFFMELWLFIMGIIYNVRPMRSKEIPYIDVLSESLNNAIRLLIGWFIITSNYLPPVTIVLGYWMGGAFLMVIKRYAEYRMIGDKETAGFYRKSFQRYSEKSLLISAFFYAMASVFFCGIFMIKYKIELLLAIPFLCGLFCYYLNLSYKSDSSVQKPEKLFKERGLMIYILLFIFIVYDLMMIDLPFLEWFLRTSIIGV